MPRVGSRDVAHTANTDHRILRGGKRELPRPLSSPAEEERFALLPFPALRPRPGDFRQKRELGLALVQAAGGHRVEPAGATRQALRLLDASLSRSPGDGEVWEARGAALLLQNAPAEALESFRKALALAPNNERTLAAAAPVAQVLGHEEIALDYWRQAARMNPWMASYRAGLARLLVRRQAWEEARGEIAAWLRLDPTSADARMLWISWLLHEGNQAEARRQFSQVEALQPPDLAARRKLFAQQLAPSLRSD
jgi:tetratricopeptide (TPR) repeat protein